MPPAARVTDMTPHPGVITGPGSPNVLINSLPASKLGDLHTCSFPPPAVHPPSPMVGPGSPTVLINGVPAMRLGDMSGCGAPVLSGSPDVMIG